MPLAIDNSSSNRNIRAVFYSLWIIISAAQAYYSNLIPDEAYYWKYSQHLAWGYFDHPPAIAIIIKAGYSILQNELGVRLVSILSIACTIFITEIFVRPKDLRLFYMSVSSVAVLHIIGILAVPDVPLLFFTATFFLLYRKYIFQNNLYLVLLLALNVTLLLLSKYHGVLVIFFTVLSDPSLLRRRSFWLLALLSAALFVPHILWQMRNGFPSISYHLFDRNPLHYDISSTLSYLASIPLIFAPATGIVLLYYGLRFPTANSFERALKYNLRGILIFFFLMSFRGRIEGNWILLTIIPAITLGYQSLVRRPWAKRFIKISFIISVVLILAARTLLIDGLWNIKNDFTGWKQWASDVQKQAGGNTPVAFMNSYQKASEYEFYAHAKAFSFNNIMGRKNQYDIWNYENELQGGRVMLISNFYIDELLSFETSSGSHQYCIIDNFHSSSNIVIAPTVESLTIIDADSFTIGIRLSVRKGSVVDAEANSAFPMMVSYQYFNEAGLVSNTITGFKVTNAILRNCQKHSLRVAAPPLKGNYVLYISVATGWLPPSINGAKVLIHNR